MQTQSLLCCQNGFKADLKLPAHHKQQFIQSRKKGRKKSAGEFTKQFALVALQAGLCAGMAGSVSPVW
jgi:hypothetical protein